MTERMRYFNARATVGLALLMLSGTVAGAEQDAANEPQQNESGQTEAAEGGNEASVRWSFDAIDGNGDGVLTEEEARDTRLWKDWQTLDENGDGRISQDEFSTYMNANVSEDEMKAMTGNNDGAAAPVESWFTSPEHKPEDDE